jgi:hypothetical protein
MGKKDSTKKIYHKKELYDCLENAINEDLSLFYKEPYVYNNTIIGGTTDKSCYEFVTEYLIEKINKSDIFKNNIKEIPRSQKYNIKRKSKGEKWEKWFAKSLLENKIGDLGEIIHYETPIWTTGYNAGDIDLLAYNGKQLSLIELKLEKNEDSMLHTILQINTYYHQLNKTKLKKEFNCQDANIQKVVLIFKGSRQYQEYEKSESLKTLAKKLGVKIYLFDCIEAI